MRGVTYEDRVAVVTGAGQGLGRQHALEIARLGGAVVLNDLDGGPDSRVTAVALEIRDLGGQAIVCGGSVAEPGIGERLLAAALDEFGRVDALVNNAGIIRDRSFAKLSSEELTQVIDVHLMGAFHVTQPVFVQMREQGYGRLVFTSSASGLFGNFGQANYGAAKAGLLGLSNVLAIEGAKYGIKSNVISPVAITPMTAGTFEDYGEVFDPTYVSPFVAYLGSEQCAVTGEIFSVGAGQVSRIFVGLSRGIFQGDRPFSADELADSIDEIRDLSEAIVPESLNDEMEKFLELLGERR